MLSTDTLNKLMKPIIDRQENINTYVITKIARRVNNIGKVLSSDVYQLTRLRDVGADVKVINAELATLTGLQVRDIQNLIKTVAQATYIDAKPFYDYRHKSFIPYKENTYIQREVEAIARQTSNTYMNLSKSQAFMLRDRANPQKLVPTPLSKAYQDIVDEAIQAAQSGTIDYHTAMRRTISQLGESGYRSIRYTTESGKVYTQRMDTAVRRNLMDGMRQVNQQVWLITGEEFGSDGVEVSAHPYPAPDHAAMQGHQYTNAEFNNMQSALPFKDVQGREYEGFDRQVGTLNCYHIARPIIIGIFKQTYTDDQLNNMLKQNEQGYTLKNGKHLTMYECTQRQRQLETKIRYMKDGQIAAKESGDRVLAEKYQAKINKYTKQYESFSKACGISKKPDRARVSGYHKIKVK